MPLPWAVKYSLVRDVDDKCEANPIWDEEEIPPNSLQYGISA